MSKTSVCEIKNQNDGLIGIREDPDPSSSSLHDRSEGVPTDSMVKGIIIPVDLAGDAFSEGGICRLE